MSVKLTGESMQSSERSFDFGYFKLRNNHDKAIVRLLHEDYDDFSRRPVHHVKLPGRDYRKGVNCLRSDVDPESACPFCSSQISDTIVSKRRKRIYIEFLVYKILDRDNRVLEDYTSNPKRMVWEQSRKLDDKIFSLSSRYNPLCDSVFQVERFGEANSTETSYDIYAIDVDKSMYPFELPEETYNPDGSYLLDKTFDEMNYYLENGDFPPKEDREYRARSDVQGQTVQKEAENSYSDIVQPMPVEDYKEEKVQQVVQEQPQVQSRRRRI